MPTNRFEVAQSLVPGQLREGHDPALPGAFEQDILTMTQHTHNRWFTSIGQIEQAFTTQNCICGRTLATTIYLSATPGKSTGQFRQIGTATEPLPPASLCVIHDKS